MLPARGVGESLFNSIKRLGRRQEPDSLVPTHRSVATNHPGLSITEMPWAGTGTTQVSMSSRLLYLFLIAIKNKPKQTTKEPKQVNKTGFGDQPNHQAPCCVYSTATATSRRGRMSLQGARFSSLRETSCHCRAE